MKLMYDYGEYNDTINVFLEYLIKDSFTEFMQQAKNGEIDIEKDKETFGTFFSYIQELLYYKYKSSPNNFLVFLKSIAGNLKIITVLPTNQRKVYGMRNLQKPQILYLNPDLKSSERLTKEERTRLYLAHEVGHFENSKWMEKVEEYVNNQVENGNFTKEQAQLMYDGFSLLDEATTQDRAENYAYWSLEKKRPNIVTYIDEEIYEGEPFKTNFDFYYDLQESAIMFARTLRGIGKVEDDEEALRILSERATSPDFFDNIISEYKKDGQMSNFIKIIQCMGNLKRTSYARFGKADKEYLKNQKKYLLDFKEIAESLRDYREPLPDGDSR